MDTALLPAGERSSLACRAAPHSHPAPRPDHCLPREPLHRHPTLIPLEPLHTKQAPYDPEEVPSGKVIAGKLQALLGKHFPLTDKPRTNGSNLRKLVTSILDDGTVCVADKEDYITVPIRGKGVPRLLACLCDTYIVTTGQIYNLQVWNRFPESSDILIRYTHSTRTIRCRDILFVFVKIDPAEEKIDSIIVATPQYIVDKFGPFGVPTVKYQMIISNMKREQILTQERRYLFKDDTEKLAKHTGFGLHSDKTNLYSSPKSGEILPLREIKERVINSLIGLKIEGSDTKTKGQFLERFIATLLGYDASGSLAAGYPDLPNQLLEVKVQDSPTVDLGKYSPGNPEMIDMSMKLTTEDVRYIIALTNHEGIVEGVIIASGRSLCDEYTIVSGTSYKCQRSIPMSFFTDQKGKSTFNP